MCLDQVITLLYFSITYSNTSLKYLKSDFKQNRHSPAHCTQYNFGFFFFIKFSTFMRKLILKI